MKTIQTVARLLARNWKQDKTPNVLCCFCGCAKPDPGLCVLCGRWS